MASRSAVAIGPIMEDDTTARASWNRVLDQEGTVGFRSIPAKPGNPVVSRCSTVKPSLPANKTMADGDKY
jgi:hypothetical protein